MKVKERIIQKVQELEDPQLLHLLEDLLNSVSDLKENFSAEELDAVMEGFADYKSGDLLDQEEVQQQFKKWLAEE